MGLTHWKSHGPKGFGDIIAGLFLALLGLGGLFFYVRGIIRGDLSFVSIILIGLALLFYVPFLVFGGVNEIVESIEEMKKRKKKEKEKLAAKEFGTALDSYLKSLSHDEFCEFMKGFSSKTDQQNDEDYP